MSFKKDCQYFLGAGLNNGKEVGVCNESHGEREIINSCPDVCKSYNSYEQKKRYKEAREKIYDRELLSAELAEVIGEAIKLKIEESETVKKIIMNFFDELDPIDEDY